MFRGYYRWHHMFIWLGVQIEILQVTEHNICSSGAVMSHGAKLYIFTHFEAQFGWWSIVVMTDDKMPICSVQRVIWRVTEHMVIIVQYADDKWQALMDAVELYVKGMWITGLKTGRSLRMKSLILKASIMTQVMMTLSNRSFFIFQ